MRNDRLLIIAICLILIGGAGVFGARTQKRAAFRGGSMAGMMGGGGMKSMMQNMMKGMLPPGIKQSDLPDSGSHGAKLLARYCTQCHKLPSPAMHSATEWPVVADRMYRRMDMMSNMMGNMMGRGMMMSVETPSKREKGAIVAYLSDNALKSMQAGTLPDPESPGAVAFMKVCTQCHEAPDISLHAADEWAAVVARMRSNMIEMEKQVLTEDERKDIVEYLAENSAG